MKDIFFLIAIICCTTIGYAQQPQTLIVPGKAIEKSRGQNPRIKEGKPTKDAAAAKAKVICIVEFKNNTGYTIDVYMHGIYQGTIGAYGSSKINVGAAKEKIYCISSGGTREWEFKENFDCGFDVIELA